MDTKILTSFDTHCSNYLFSSNIRRMWLMFFIYLIMWSVFWTQPYWFIWNLCEIMKNLLKSLSSSRGYFFRCNFPYCLDIFIWIFKLVWPTRDIFFWRPSANNFILLYNVDAKSHAFAWATDIYGFIRLSLTCLWI